MPSCAERLQFAGLGLAVVVRVDPDDQVLEVRVAWRQHAVAVAVVLRHRLVAVARALAVGQLRADAEQLAAVVDPAVVVQVDREQAVGASTSSRIVRGVARGGDVEA